MGRLLRSAGASGSIRAFLARPGRHRARFGKVVWQRGEPRQPGGEKVSLREGLEPAQKRGIVTRHLHNRQIRLQL